MAGPLRVRAGTEAAGVERYPALARLPLVVRGDLQEIVDEPLTGFVRLAFAARGEPEDRTVLRMPVRARGDLQVETLIRMPMVLQGDLTGTPALPMGGRVAMPITPRGDLTVAQTVRLPLTLRGDIVGAPGVAYSFARTQVLAPQPDFATATLSNWVVRNLTLAGSYLRSRANGGKIANGALDVLFQDAVGNVLPHDVESHDAVNGVVVLHLGIPSWANSASQPFLVRFLYGNTAISSSTEQPALTWTAASATWRTDTGVCSSSSARNLTPSGVTAAKFGQAAAGVLGATSSLKATNPSYLAGLQRFTLDLRIDPASLSTAGTLFRVGSPTSTADADTRILVRFLPSITVGSPAVTLRNCLRVSVRLGTTTHTVHTADDTVDLTDQVFHVVCETGRETKVYRNGELLAVGDAGATATGGLSVLSTDELAIGDNSTSEAGLAGTYGRVTFWPFAQGQPRMRLDDRVMRDTADVLGVGAEETPTATDRGAVAVPLRARAKLNEDTTIDVVASAVDPEAGTVTLTSVAGATRGTASIVSGRVVYRRTAAGTDLLTFTVRDAQTAKPSSARLTILDPPAVPDHFTLGWEVDPDNAGKKRDPVSKRWFNPGSFQGTRASYNSYNGCQPSYYGYNAVMYGADPPPAGPGAVTTWERLAGPNNDDYTSVGSNVTMCNVRHMNNTEWQSRPSMWLGLYCATLPRGSLVSVCEAAARGDTDIINWWKRFAKRLRYSIDNFSGADYRKLVLRPNWEGMNQNTGLAVDGSKNWYNAGLSQTQYNNMMRHWIATVREHYDYDDLYIAFSPAFETTDGPTNLTYDSYMEDDNGVVGYNMTCSSVHPHAQRANTLIKARRIITGEGLTDGPFYWAQLALDTAKRRNLVYAALEHGSWDEGGTPNHGTTQFYGDSYAAFGQMLNDPANYGYIAFTGHQGSASFNEGFNPRCSVFGHTVANTGSIVRCDAHTGPVRNADNTVTPGTVFWQAPNQADWARQCRMGRKYLGYKPTYADAEVT